MLLSDSKAIFKDLKYNAISVTVSQSFSLKTDGMLPEHKFNENNL